jgi:hypothetical protein
MKKTKLTPLKPAKIKVLTMPTSFLKLNKCAKDEFAITTSGYRVLYAFESQSLSELFAREGHKKLRCIRLNEKSTQHGSGAKRLIEIYLQFRDGRKFILDERDRLFELNEITQKEKLYSPCGVWGLIPKEPIVHVLLSAKMVDLIESIASEDQLEHVVRTFWHDWLLTKSKPSMPKKTIRIRGEFGVFKANKINSIMVKFDTA